MKQKLLFTLVTIGFCLQSFAQISNREVADNWLTKHTNELLIQPNHTFNMLFSRSGLSGETFRYYQMLNDVQVFDAEITVHVSNKGNVSYHASSYKKDIETINTVPVISESQALNKALNHLDIQASDINISTNKLFVNNFSDVTTLVRRVTITSYSRVGEWEVMIDANSEEVLGSRDIAVYHDIKSDKEKEKKKKNKNNVTVSVMATGTGYVFETDPLTATTSVYGGQYVDGNDATNATLDAARSLVTLNDINLTGGVYKLSGPYADIAEVSAPNKGLFTQNSNTFNFNREEDGFEAVNIYYHLDKYLRYLNVNLGLSVAPSGNGGIVRFDAHGANGADQSFYSPGGQYVVFGEGCVDDGEDADVIVHEVGHGVHDWITNGATSPYLGEGNGDYMAGSYKRSFGQWSNTDASYNYMFGWDGHNPCWGGRSTGDTRLYPAGLVGLQGGAAHNDGQMWASVLMEIWDIIGRDKTDKAFIEGVSMTNTTTNQQDAAIAVRQAAIDMGTAGGYTCADIQAFTDRFTARGYVLPAYTCNLGVDDFSISNLSIFPNPATTSIAFNNLNDNYDVTILNLLGQTVLNTKISNTNSEINISTLTSGAYFIKLKGVDKVFKLIKK